MNRNADLSETDFADGRSAMLQLSGALESAIVGQSELIEQLTIAFFAGGHCLIEGLPGLGKTHLAKALAATTGLGFARVQCTPDLMPGDVTGSEILLKDPRGAQAFRFQPGPIFSPIVLVDEINRATPKTQSALLEAMQEHQVTCSGTTHRLPAPFWVLATQNPIEIEGTYPLPEAQLDRFLVKLQVEFPGRAALLAMLDVSLDSEPAESLRPVLDPARVVQLMSLGRKIVVAERIKKAAVQLLLSTHPAPSDDRRGQFRYGASPRGLQALIRTARVRALLDQRLQVDLEDLHAMALPTLRHRVLLTLESELDGVDSEQLLRQRIDAWRELA